MFIMVYGFSPSIGFFWDTDYFAGDGGKKQTVVAQEWGCGNTWERSATRERIFNYNNREGQTAAVPLRTSWVWERGVILLDL